MARCPHCNMVLSDSEFKAASCTICKGSLANSPNDKLETSTSRTSGTISRVDNADDDAGGAASRLVERSVEDPSRPGTVRTIRPTRGIALLALLGAWYPFLPTPRPTTTLPTKGRAICQCAALGGILTTVKKLTAPQVLARRVQRAQVGRLKDQNISARKRESYTTAVHHFSTFAALVGLALGTTVDELDMQIAEYIEYLWERGISCSTAANTISGVQRFLGTQRNALKVAWSLLTVWRRHEQPIQAPPMPVLVLVGMVSCIGHEGDWRLAASLALGFAACLRTDEMISLVVANIEWATDCLILHLETSKTMKRGRAQERILVTDPLALRLVRSAVARLRPSDTLMGLSARQFRTAFASCLAKWQLDGRYQP